MKLPPEFWATINGVPPTGSEAIAPLMAVEHYENFPVASFLLPARLRPAVKALYQFARSADDIADEGDASESERLASLQYYTEELDRVAEGIPPESSEFVVLESIVRQFQLPLKPMYGLLAAFKQDVSQKRYVSYRQLLGYCELSANPVGELMLHLYDAATDRNLRDANAICTALQLINFWQDVAIDWEKQRVYLPQEDLQRFEVSEHQISQGNCDLAWTKLMQFEVERARALMLSGSQLACRLPGRVGLELRGVVQGGLRICEKIDAVHGDVFHRRPVISSWDWVVIACRMLLM